KIIIKIQYHNYTWMLRECLTLIERKKTRTIVSNVKKGEYEIIKPNFLKRLRNRSVLSIDNSILLCILMVRSTVCLYP
ncbi:MAG: hypothetical protein JSW04_05985, partial [Desulfobacterales bacterium]